MEIAGPRPNCASAKRLSWRLAKIVCLASVVFATTGCPDLAPYEQGFEEGLAQDDWFFFGFDDSWLTLGDGPILYSGGDIPLIEELTFDAGFNDGIWTTYNDGYFEAYRSAILIGFQDGYNRAFQPDYLEFLTTDEHVEFLHGGYSDGYNDGFSEGRVFGAWDISDDPPLIEGDWQLAYSDWLHGEDLFFEDIEVGTGDSGPVIFYEWGTDPNTFSKRDLPSTRRNGAKHSLRKSGGEVRVKSLTKQ